MTTASSIAFEDPVIVLENHFEKFDEQPQLLFIPMKLHATFICTNAGPKANPAPPGIAVTAEDKLVHGEGFVLHYHFSGASKSTSPL